MSRVSATDSQTNSTTSSRPRQNFGGSAHHNYGIGTNADPTISSMSGRDRDRHRTHSPNGDPSSSSRAGNGTNSGSGRATSSAHSAHSSQSAKSTTGPVKAYPKDSSVKGHTDSESGAKKLHFDGGVKGTMRDVEDDQVLVSISDTKADRMGSEEHTSIGKTGSEPSAASEHTNKRDKETKDHKSLRRQGSGPYSSGEKLHSGHGVIGQPESAESEAQHKVLPGEDSIDLIEYNRKLSRASSSGSSHERVPASGRHREDSTDSGRVAELQAKYEEEMIRLTEKLSAAEDATEQLRKENQKLIRKLADAEEVTEQSEVATIEVSRLEAELKRERDEREKILRDRSHSPDPTGGAISIQLSQELEIVKSRLAWEVEAKTALEQQMTSMKQSLVVSGKEDILKRSAVLVEMQKEMAELRETVHKLQQALSEKEVEMKRQNQVHTRTIADLQTKLSKERQQREELRKSVGGGTRPSEAASTADTTALTAALHEKERVIQQQTEQLQKLEETAKNSVKITMHSRQQSGKIATLKRDLLQAQKLLEEREKALKTSSDEVAGIKTQYDKTLRMKNAELAQHSEQVKQLHSEVEGQVSELSSAVEEGGAKRAELQQSLQRYEKECNHWKQKSVQQDMVLQTARGDVDRLHREVNGLNSTVAAQGQEVERLQRENRTLQGEIETHRITAATYKEDFESERKDREAVHTKIANMEDQYRHQLQSLAEQLQRKTEEAQRHKDTLTNTQQLLQKQQEQMTAQLLQKEEELNTMYVRNQQLQEDVMSKTQQVKQYKKQIDQLSSEESTYRQQADAHKTQIEFYAKKTEEYARQRTLRELQEKKMFDMESQCDELRAENNALRMKKDNLQPSRGGVDARPRVVLNQDRMAALPNPHPQGRLANMGRSLDDNRLHNRAGGPSTHHQSPHQNNTLPPPAPQQQRTAPYSAVGVTDGNMAPQQPTRPPVGGTGGAFRPENTAAPRQSAMGGQYYNIPPSNYHPHLQRQDSPYSSLPAHGSGCFPPQPQPRPPAYAHDDSSALYSPGGDVVDKDSPPSSTVDQGPQQLDLQRRAHSQMLSMAGSGSAQRYPPPSQHFRPPSQQPPNSHIYHNIPIIPSNSGGQYMAGQRSSVGASGQPSPHVPRPPQPQHMPAMSRDNQYSTPVEESHRRRLSGKPPLEGYIKPQQASSHPIASQHLAVERPAGHYENSSSPSRPAGSSVHNPQHASVGPSPSTGDISKDITNVIEETASKVRAAERVGERGESEGIPYDPNLVCPKCKMKFREGEIQKYRRHVSSPH